MIVSYLTHLYRKTCFKSDFKEFYSSDAGSNTLNINYVFIFLVTPNNDIPFRFVDFLCVIQCGFLTSGVFISMIFIFKVFLIDLLKYYRKKYPHNLKENYVLLTDFVGVIQSLQPYLDFFILPVQI